MLVMAVESLLLPRMFLFSKLVSTLLFVLSLPPNQWVLQSSSSWVLRVGKSGGGVQPPPGPVVQLLGQQSGQQHGQPLGAQPALPLQGQHRGPQVIQQDLFSPFSLSQTLSLSGVQPCGGGGGEGSVVQFNSHQPGLHPSQPQLGQPQWPGLPLPGLLPPLQIF